MYIIPNFIIFSSELYQHAAINLAARQIIGHGILLVGHVRNPVIGVHVVDAKKVEAIHTQPDIADGIAFVLALVVVKGPETHADVCAFVGWGPEVEALYASVWGGERQPIGVSQLEGHLPTLGVGEIISEIEARRRILRERTE